MPPTNSNDLAANLMAFKGHWPEIGQNIYIHPSANVIGQVKLGADSSVWPSAVIRGDVNHIHIGKGTNIQDLSVLHVSHQSTNDPAGAPLVIGDYVTIGHTVILHGCTIEDECLIGMGSIVMDKVVIQKHVLLAAGSLVPEGRTLESGFLYMGRPAQKVRPLTATEIAHFMHSAQMYMALKDEYLKG